MLKPLIVSILFGLISGPCSRAGNDPALQFQSPSPSPSVSEGLPTRPYAEMLKVVTRLSKETGIVNLKAANLPADQTEIRIWKGLGLVTPRCFRIVLTNGNPAASFVSVKISGNRAVMRNGREVYSVTPVSAPQSGWDDFLAFLKDNGIGSSIELTQDKTEMPETDGEALIIEMKNGSGHMLVYFDETTTSTEGKKAFAICKRIESDFGINLGCR